MSEFSDCAEVGLKFFGLIKSKRSIEGWSVDGRRGVTEVVQCLSINPANRLNSSVYTFLFKT